MLRKKKINVIVSFTNNRLLFSFTFASLALALAFWIIASQNALLAFAHSPVFGVVLFWGHQNQFLI